MNPFRRSGLIMRERSFSAAGEVGAGTASDSAMGSFSLGGNDIPEVLEEKSGVSWPAGRQRSQGGPGRSVLAVLPLLPVGGRAMGEEGRGDEGCCGRQVEG